MQRLLIDDVPVFWEQGPAPLSVGLCFGVGRRDESFVTGGTTHLLEHVVMGSLPKRHLDRNASVGPSITEFTATGRPEAVAEFLQQVCLALADPPTDRLRTEARVLAAEEAQRGGDLLGHALLVRYGGTGPGLLGMTEPGLPGLTADQLRDHARRWFVRQNAALWLTGPPPEGLTLPLLSGVQARRHEQRRLPLRLPGQVRYPGVDPALSFEAPADDATLCALRILVERMTDRLRRQGGHSYDVDCSTDAVDAGGAHVTFFADAADSEVAPVLEGMWEELWRFADEGPTAEELAHDVEGVREHFDDPRSVEGIVASAAVRHLQALPPQDRRERLRAAEALSAQDVAAAVRGALGGGLALVPEDAPPLLSSVVELPNGTAERVTGRTCKRRLRADVPRGSRLVVGSEGVALVVGDEHVAVRYDDCVAVGVGVGDHAHVELVGGHGMTVVVRGDDWKDGAALVAEVLAHTGSVPRFQVQPVRLDR